MSRKRVKQYLTMLMVVGIVAIASGGGSGTFASFTAEVSNNGNTFETGTLTLGADAGDTGASCWSTGDGAVSHTNNTAVCNAIFTNVNWQPGTAAKKYEITIENGGTVNGTLSVYATACTHSNASLSATAQYVYQGTGDPCQAIAISIQQLTSSNTSSTTGSCLLPASGSCSTGTVLSNLGTSVTHATSLGTIDASGTSTATKKYFLVTVIFPASSSSDNEYQGLDASFGLTWHLEQS